MSPAKTKAQVEFKDLFDVLEKRGWTKAALARRLGYSANAAVSMILKGDTGVSEFRLKILRELVAKEEGKPVNETGGRIQNAETQLRYLKEHAPASYAAATATINALHQTAVQGVSSSVSDVAIASQASAEAVAREIVVTSSGRKRATGGPSARKPQPKQAAGPASSTPHAAPKPVPK